MPFERIESELPGAAVLVHPVFGDERGFFSETFRESDLAELGITDRWVQDNHSRSRRGVVRGMHFQIGEGAAKLVRCGRGEIVDVIVDLRRGSPTYARWESFPLTEDNGRILYVPVGFGHGFVVVSDVADVFYKQSNYYSAEVERGIRFDDPDVGIEWPLAPDDLIPSERDRTAPTLAEFESELPFTY